MIETSPAKHAKIEIDQDVINSPLLKMINSEEFKSLPLQERMDFILDSHKGKNIDTPLFPQEIEIIREHLEIEDLEPELDITISGLSYTGKTLLAEYTAQILETEHWDGKEVHDRRKKGEVETGKDIHSIKAHQDFDELQRQEFLNADPDAKGKVKQARLAGVALAEAMDIRDAQIQQREVEIAKKLQRRQAQNVRIPEPLPQIRAESYLIEASEKARIERALKDDHNKAKSNGVPRSLWSTEDEMLERVRARDEDSLTKWRKGHKKYGILTDETEPFDENLARPNGMPVYSRIISTTKKSPLEGSIYLIKRYKEAGGFRKKNITEQDQANKNVPKLTDELEEVRLILGWKMPETIAELDDLEKVWGEALKQDKEENEANKNKSKQVEIFNSEKAGEKDAIKTNKKIKKNGKNHPKGSFGGKTKSTTRSGKSFCEPVSKRYKFPEKHPNPHHPSRNKKSQEKRKTNS